MSNPNILFLFSDQQRWDTLGCYHPAMDFTPNLDRLAAEGVRFENAFTCQPVCGPARACLQTGRYATQLGCYRNGIALPRDAVTVAERLHQNGYETAYVGKWHLASTGTKPVPPALRGGYRDYWMAADVLEFTSDGYGGHMFDAEGRRREFTGYRADRQTDFALEYLQNRKCDRPFFLFVSYLEPHHQNNAGHFQGPAGSKERFRRYPVPEDLKRLGGGDWEREYPDYLGCCASLDYNAGRLVHELKEQGLYEDTVIVYTSDHGSHFRTRNGEYKRSCHESSIRVPLVLRGPGFTGGQAVGELASLMDLPATLLRCGGVEIPPGMQGKPLQELVAGNVDAWPQEVFLQISESQVGRALRTKRWKYSVKAPYRNGWFHAGAKLYREEFLYDLENDPYEQDNLVGHAAYAQVRARLRQRLVERMEAAGEEAPRILDRRWRLCPR
ncbi:MAG: sulfatase-like hydrolase/transferase [Oscillospiraceae bacterium]|nr:sulfatase-like hydrolase/transferase [Oscillospiraceae bacterium]